MQEFPLCKQHALLSINITLPIMKIKTNMYIIANFRILPQTNKKCTSLQDKCLEECLSCKVETGKIYMCLNFQKHEWFNGGEFSNINYEGLS